MAAGARLVSPSSSREAGVAGVVWKFQFPGDLDCPKWVLAEIGTLAKMVECTGSSLGGGGVLGLGIVGVEDGASIQEGGVRFASLADVRTSLPILCEVAAALQPDTKELLGQGNDYEKILKLTADVKFVQPSSVDGESLASELQQLGLPKEHAASLCHCYEEKQSPLQKHLWIYSLRSNPKVQSFGVQEGRSLWLCDLGLVPGSLWL
ncbi:COMM domain-containing protein 4-like [Macaca nemestrina]|uniref:COMM domain-containing protein 4-like n=1 Tax=Macaca nemestrina TaxID=9545 RepID=UPI0039B95AD9